MSLVAAQLMMSRNPVGLRATDRDQHEAAILGAMARIPRSQTGFEEVFRAVMAQIEEAFDFTVGVLAFVDDDDTVELATILTRPVPPQLVEATQNRALETLLAERRHVPFAHVTRRVFEPADDFVTDAAAVLTDVSAVPLSTAGRLSGVLILAGHRIGPASQPFLELLANQAHLVCEHNRLTERVRGLAVRDSLTGAFSRRQIVERLAMEFERARRHRTGLSIVMLDVDDLGGLNRDHGHPAGGVVLREIARRISESLRGSDAIGRYDGGKFLVILPHTPHDGAMVVAERARALVASQPFDLGAECVTLCTITAGVASAACPRVHGAAGLVYEAEQAMIQAKHAGANRVGSAT